MFGWCYCYSTKEIEYVERIPAYLENIVVLKMDNELLLEVNKDEQKLWCSGKVAFWLDMRNSFMMTPDWIL